MTPIFLEYFSSGSYLRTLFNHLSSKHPFSTDYYHLYLHHHLHHHHQALPSCFRQSRQFLTIHRQEASGMTQDCGSLQGMQITREGA